MHVLLSAKGRVPAVYLQSLVGLSLVLKFCCVQPEPSLQVWASDCSGQVLHVCPCLLADELRAFGVWQDPAKFALQSRNLACKPPFLSWLFAQALRRHLARWTAMVTKDNCAKIAAVSFVTGVAVGWLLNRYARLVRAGTCFILATSTARTATLVY